MPKRFGELRRDLSPGANSIISEILRNQPPGLRIKGVDLPEFATTRFIDDSEEIEYLGKGRRFDRISVLRDQYPEDASILASEGYLFQEPIDLGISGQTTVIHFLDPLGRPGSEASGLYTADQRTQTRIAEQHLASRSKAERSGGFAFGSGAPTVSLSVYKEIIGDTYERLVARSGGPAPDAGEQFIRQETGTPIEDPYERFVRQQTGAVPVGVGNIAYIEDRPVIWNEHSLTERTVLGIEREARERGQVSLMTSLTGGQVLLGRMDSEIISRDLKIKLGMDLREEGSFFQDLRKELGGKPTLRTVDLVQHVVDFTTNDFFRMMEHAQELKEQGVSPLGALLRSITETESDYRDLMVFEGLNLIADSTFNNSLVAPDAALSVLAFKSVAPISQAAGSTATKGALALTAGSKNPAIEGLRGGIAQREPQSLLGVPLQVPTATGQSIPLFGRVPSALPQEPQSIGSAVTQTMAGAAGGIAASLPLAGLGGAVGTMVAGKALGTGFGLAARLMSDSAKVANSARLAGATVARYAGVNTILAAHPVTGDVREYQDAIRMLAGDNEFIEGALGADMDPDEFLTKWIISNFQLSLPIEGLGAGLRALRTSRTMPLRAHAEMLSRTPEQLKSLILDTTVPKEQQAAMVALAKNIRDVDAARRSFVSFRNDSDSFGEMIERSGLTPEKDLHPFFGLAPRRVQKAVMRAVYGPEVVTSALAGEILDIVHRPTGLGRVILDDGTPWRPDPGLTTSEMAQLQATGVENPGQVIYNPFAKQGSPERLTFAFRGRPNPKQIESMLVRAQAVDIDSFHVVVESGSIRGAFNAETVKLLTELSAEDAVGVSDVLIRTGFNDLDSLQASWMLMAGKEAAGIRVLGEFGGMSESVAKKMLPEFRESVAGIFKKLTEKQQRALAYSTGIITDKQAKAIHKTKTRRKVFGEEKDVEVSTFRNTQHVEETFVFGSLSKEDYLLTTRRGNINKKGQQVFTAASKKTAGKEHDTMKARLDLLPKELKSGLAFRMYGIAGDTTGEWAAPGIKPRFRESSYIWTYGTGDQLKIEKFVGVGSLDDTIYWSVFTEDQKYRHILSRIKAAKTPSELGEAFSRWRADLVNTQAQQETIAQTMSEKIHFMTGEEFRTETLPQRATRLGVSIKDIESFVPEVAELLRVGNVEELGGAVPAVADAILRRRALQNLPKDVSKGRLKKEMGKVSSQERLRLERNLREMVDEELLARIGEGKESLGEDVEILGRKVWLRQDVETAMQSAYEKINADYSEAAVEIVRRFNDPLIPAGVRGILGVDEMKDILNQMQRQNPSLASESIKSGQSVFSGIQRPMWAIAHSDPSYNLIQAMRQRELWVEFTGVLFKDKWYAATSLLRPRELKALPTVMESLRRIRAAELESYGLQRQVPWLSADELARVKRAAQMIRDEVLDPLIKMNGLDSGELFSSYFMRMMSYKGVLDGAPNFEAPGWMAPKHEARLRHMLKRERLTPWELDEDPNIVGEMFVYAAVRRAGFDTLGRTWDDLKRSWNGEKAKFDTSQPWIDQYGSATWKPSDTTINEVNSIIDGILQRPHNMDRAFSQRLSASFYRRMAGKDMPEWEVARRGSFFDKMFAEWAHNSGSHPLTRMAGTLMGFMFIQKLGLNPMSAIVLNASQPILTAGVEPNGVKKVMRSYGDLIDLADNADPVAQLAHAYFNVSALNIDANQYRVTPAAWETFSKKHFRLWGKFDKIASRFWAITEVPNRWTAFAGEFNVALKFGEEGSKFVTRSSRTGEAVRISPLSADDLFTAGIQAADRQHFGGRATARAAMRRNPIGAVATQFLSHIFNMAMLTAQDMQNLRSPMKRFVDEYTDLPKSERPAFVAERLTMDEPWVRRAVRMSKRFIFAGGYAAALATIWGTDFGYSASKIAFLPTIDPVALQNGELQFDDSVKVFGTIFSSAQSAGQGTMAAYRLVRHALDVPMDQESKRKALSNVLGALLTALPFEVQLSRINRALTDPNMTDDDRAWHLLGVSPAARQRHRGQQEIKKIKALQAIGPIAK